MEFWLLREVFDVWRQTDMFVIHLTSSELITGYWATGCPHEREPLYPVHLTLNPTGRKRADWKVRDIFIEYFGLLGDAGYEKKITKMNLEAPPFGRGSLLRKFF